MGSDGTDEAASKDDASSEAPREGAGTSSEPHDGHEPLRSSTHERPRPPARDARAASVVRRTSVDVVQKRVVRKVRLTRGAEPPESPAAPEDGPPRRADGANDARAVADDSATVTRPSPWASSAEPSGAEPPSGAGESVSSAAAPRPDGVAASAASRRQPRAVGAADATHTITQTRARQASPSGPSQHGPAGADRPRPRAASGAGLRADAPRSSEAATVALDVSIDAGDGATPGPSPDGAASAPSSRPVAARVADAGSTLAMPSTHAGSTDRRRVEPGDGVAAPPDAPATSETRGLLAPSSVPAPKARESLVELDEPFESNVAPIPRPTLAPQSLAEGDVIAGRYRVEGRLATSEMSILYRAVHLELERMVVVKVLQAPQGADDRAAENAEAVARFKREARLMARVKSEHVAKVLDVGSHRGCPFIAMELLEGTDLAGLVKQVHRLPLVQASDLVLQVCEGLAVAHAQGIVHRDLKPANVFVSVRAAGDLRVTIIDFGIAKAFGDDHRDDVTRSTLLLGSPRYMAPEQVARKEVIDQRADVWALGVIFQELLTGERVFDAEGVVPTLLAIASHPPIPLKQRWPEAPDEIAHVIGAALVKDPAHRLPDVLEFAKHLVPFASADAPQRVANIAASLARPLRRPSSQFEIAAAAAPERAPSSSHPSLPAVHLKTPLLPPPESHGRPPLTGPAGVAAPPAPVDLHATTRTPSSGPSLAAAPSSGRSPAAAPSSVRSLAAAPSSGRLPAAAPSPLVRREEAGAGAPTRSPGAPPR
ncbi:MAG: protein kinase, partial [Labilithrix sp.]|nr:protein kinase [Labilithrix sp.]